MIRRPPRFPLFPSPTLFRSRTAIPSARRSVRLLEGLEDDALFFPSDTDTRIDYRQCDHVPGAVQNRVDRKSTRLNSSHGYISYAVFCLKKKKKSSVSHVMFE